MICEESRDFIVLLLSRMETAIFNEKTNIPITRQSAKGRSQMYSKTR